MDIKSNQGMNLYEIMDKWTSNLNDKINNNHQEQVNDNEALEPIRQKNNKTIQVINETKKITKEFSKNYQKVLKELSIINEEMTENNDEKVTINKGVSELIEGYMITYEPNKTKRETIQHWYKYGKEFKEKLDEIKNGKISKTPDHIARKQLYQRIKNKGIEKVTLSTIKTRTQNSLKVYDLFSEIGTEKIDRIKNCSWNNLAKLTRPEIDSMIIHIKQMKKII